MRAAGGKARSEREQPEAACGAASSRCGLAFGVQKAAHYGRPGQLRFACIDIDGRSCENEPDSHTEEAMSQPERFEALVLGSGEGGKYLAWHMARSGRRAAVVERRWIGGSCPNINCLPSKNEIWSAKVAHLAHHAEQFGTMTGSVTIDMAKVRQRKRDMVDGLIAMHLQNYKASGAELISSVMKSRRPMQNVI
jgi:alkyl hydroperoxide reductase subunit AhpF